MRHRNLPEYSTLRRSPRFHKENPPTPEAPKTPKCAVRKCRVPISDLTPPLAGDSPDEFQRFQSDGRSRNPEGSKKTRSRTEKSMGLKGHRAKGLPLPSVRRSSRSSHRASDETTKERPSSNGSRKKRDADSRSGRSIPVEKRVTRSSARDSRNGGVKGCYTLRKCSSARDIGDKGVESSPGQCLYRIEKRVTRSVTRKVQAVKNSERSDVQEVSDRGEAKSGRKLFREDVVEEQDVTASVGREDVGDKMRSSEAEKKLTGKKRKRAQISKNGGVKGCNTLRKSSSARDIGVGSSPGECLYRFEKRVTRSATRSVQAVNYSECGDVQEVFDQGDAKFSSELFREDVVEKQDECLYRIEKKVTRSATRRVQAVKNSECSDVLEVSDRGKAKLGRKLFREDVVGKQDVIGREDVGDKMRRAQKKLTGTKRKRAQLREERLQSDGWTVEQEFALEKAYFAAKPTPSFWKKVAKMVPGKSARDCFNKINSELMTPPQHQTRSRAKARISPFSLSPTKLLMSPVPETKKQRKSRFAHKTVRELLKKQCNLDHENSGDLFSVLEQTLDPPTQLENNRQLFTPECGVETPLYDKRCMERPSASRKQLSGGSNSCEAALTSPLVLKKVKNKALHEKYIDQLHLREAKRKAASLRAGKSAKTGNTSKQNPVQKVAAVKDAKNALVFCAKEAINQFQHLQSSSMNQFENGSDDFSDSSENESEDGS